MGELLYTTLLLFSGASLSLTLFNMPRTLLVFAIVIFLLGLTITGLVHDQEVLAYIAELLIGEMLRGLFLGCIVGISLRVLYFVVNDWNKTNRKK